MLSVILAGLSTVLFAVLWWLHRSWLATSDRRIALPPEQDDEHSRRQEDALHRDLLVISYVAAVPGAVALYPTVSQYIQHFLDPAGLGLWPTLIVSTWSVARPLKKVTDQPKASLAGFILLSAAIGVVVLSTFVAFDLIALGSLDKKVLEDLLKGM